MPVLLGANLWRISHVSFRETLSVAFWAGTSTRDPCSQISFEWTAAGYSQSLVCPLSLMGPRLDSSILLASVVTWQTWGSTNSLMRGAHLVSNNILWLYHNATWRDVLSEVGWHPLVEAVVHHLKLLLVQDHIVDFEPLDHMSSWSSAQQITEIIAFMSLVSSAKASGIEFRICCARSIT